MSGIALRATPEGRHPVISMRYGVPGPRPSLLRLRPRATPHRSPRLRRTKTGNPLWSAIARPPRLRGDGGKPINQDPTPKNGNIKKPTAVDGLSSQRLRASAGKSVVLFFARPKEKNQKKRRPAAWSRRSAGLPSAAGRSRRELRTRPAFAGLRQAIPFDPRSPVLLGCAAMGKPGTSTAKHQTAKSNFPVSTCDRV